MTKVAVDGYFRKKSSIIDIRPDPKYAYEESVSLQLCYKFFSEKIGNE